MRGKAEPTIILPCIFIELSFLNHLPITIFHSSCLSGSYLEKYKRDCNGTWFIDRWQ